MHRFFGLYCSYPLQVEKSSRQADLSSYRFPYEAMVRTEDGFNLNVCLGSPLDGWDVCKRNWPQTSGPPCRQGT